MPTKPARILVLEDDAARVRWFRSAHVGTVVDVTDDVREAAAWLAEREYSRIYLDHDLRPEHYANGADDGFTGFAIAQLLAGRPELSPNAVIILHSLNPDGVRRMRRELHRARRNYRAVPFHALQATL